MRTVTLLLLVFTLIIASHAMADTLWIASGKNGVYSANFESETGKIDSLKLAADVGRTGFIGLHPNGKILYSVSGNDETRIHAFAIEEKGALRLLNTLETKWRGGSSLGVSPDGKLISIAYYGPSAFGVYSVNDDGTLKEVVLEVMHEGSSVHPSRQTKPHPHWSGFSPNGKFIYVPDLGTDEIWVYATGDDGESVSLHKKMKSEPGSGPRHFAFHPSGEFGFVTDELIGGVTAYRLDADTGDLLPVESLTSAPEALESEIWSNVSDLTVHPSGQFLYVANRGHDTTSVFSIDQETGKLTPVEREPVRGSWPRHLRIDESGRWCLVTGQRSETLAVFEIDADSGSLVYSLNVLHVPSPGRMELTR
jgi:6-phosphogluconolactonase